MTSVVLLGLFLLIWWCYILWSRRKYYKLMLQVPGYKGYPLLGCAISFLDRDDMLYMIHRQAMEVGNVFLTWIGPFPTLFVSDPEVVKDIFTSPNCVNKSFIYNGLTDLIGLGLVTLKDPGWSFHRKMLNPAFANKLLLNFYPIFNNEVNNLMKTFDVLADSNATGIDLRDTVLKFTFTIAVQTTMAKDLATSDTEFHLDDKILQAFKFAMKKVIQLATIAWMPKKLWRFTMNDYDMFAKSEKTMRTFIDDLIIERTEAATSQSSLDQNVFINRAIDLHQKGTFTRQEVEDEAFITVFAGSETTALTIVHAIMFLAMFPQYQERAFEEVVSVFPDLGIFDVDSANIQQLSYVEMVLNETMRVIAIVPLVAREVQQDIKLSNGLLLPKGLQVVIDIINMQRREDIWGPEAHLFNPENFLPSNLEGKHPYCFVPFTKGIRNCIGSKYAIISMKIAMAKLIRNYRFTTDYKFEDLQYVDNMTIKIKDMPLIRVHKRST